MESFITTQENTKGKEYSCNTMTDCIKFNTNFVVVEVVIQDINGGWKLLIINTVYLQLYKVIVCLFQGHALVCL